MCLLNMVFDGAFSLFSLHEGIPGTGQELTLSLQGKEEKKMLIPTGGIGLGPKYWQDGLVRDRAEYLIIFTNPNVYYKNFSPVLLDMLLLDRYSLDEVVILVMWKASRECTSSTQHPAPFKTPSSTLFSFHFQS